MDKNWDDIESFFFSDIWQIGGPVSKGRCKEYLTKEI